MKNHVLVEEKGIIIKLMKNFLVILTIIIIVAVGLFWLMKKNNQRPSSRDKNQLSTTINPMQITSPAFADNQTIPVKYTCDGEGVNPPLEFKDAPQNAKSLALIVDDPDAPNGTWVHWLMWNIAPTINQIAENSVPEGSVQGQASSGQNIYGGPCPPSVTHHYFFKLYALDSKLTLPSYSTSSELEKAMQGHMVGQAQLMGTYSRK